MRPQSSLRTEAVAARAARVQAAAALARVDAPYVLLQAAGVSGNYNIKVIERR